MKNKKESEKGNLYAVAIYGENQEYSSVNNINLDRSIRNYAIKATSRLEALGAGIEQFQLDTDKPIVMWSMTESIDN